MQDNTKRGAVVKEKVGEAGANILIAGHKCYRCGHEWRPRELEEVPPVCPKCKSPYWKTPRRKKHKVF